jgi:hypothetical protein
VSETLKSEVLAEAGRSFSAVEAERVVEESSSLLDKLILFTFKKNKKIRRVDFVF